MHIVKSFEKLKRYKFSGDGSECVFEFSFLFDEGIEISGYTFHDEIQVAILDKICDTESTMRMKYCFMLMMLQCYILEMMLSYLFLYLLS